MPAGEPGNGVQETAPAALDELQNWVRASSCAPFQLALRWHPCTPRALSENRCTIVQALDTQGYIILYQAASPAELQHTGSLASHTTLLRFAEDLCGIGYFADQPLRPVAEQWGGAAGLVGGDSCIDPSREYFHQTEGYFSPGGNQDYQSLATPARVRQCQGLVAVRSHVHKLCCCL